MAFTLIGTFRCHNKSKLLLLRAVYYSTEPHQISKDLSKKVVNVAIIGAPNSGKSTLINKIVERKICAASNKVHTTTKLSRAMTFQNDTQIIFLDTPGVVTQTEQKRYNLPVTMIGACEKSLRCADVIGVVHDVSNRFTKDTLHSDIITMLQSIDETPSFLILNKVDKFKSKKMLLSVIHNLTNGFLAGNPIPGVNPSKKRTDRGYSKFSDVFLVSALNGDGVADIKNYLITNAKLSRLHYGPDDWTDQKPDVLIEEAVRAKFLDFLSQEIPYNLRTQLEYYEEIEEENKIVCSVFVECPSERLARLVSGAGGGRLQQIKSHVRQDLMEMFKKLVVIDIVLRVSKKPE